MNDETQVLILRALTFLLVNATPPLGPNQGDADLLAMECADLADRIKESAIAEYDGSEEDRQ